MNLPPRLEKNIEASICRHLERLGLKHRKYTTPSHRSAPDRIVFFAPHGLCFFLEVKRPGEHLTPGQEQEQKNLRDLGFICEEVHSVEEAVAAYHKFLQHVKKFGIIV